MERLNNTMQAVVPAALYNAHNEAFEDLRFLRVEAMIRKYYGAIGGTGGTGGIEMLSFSNAPRGHLPELLESVLLLAENEIEADVYLLSTLAGLTSKMTNCTFRYNNHRYYPSLMLIVAGGPAAGKSKAEVARYLVAPEAAIRGERKPDDQDFDEEEEQRRYQQLDHILPADSSAAAFDKKLIDNDGTGLLITTEIDTMNKVFGTEYGDFSATIRKAYEHEPIEINRVKENEILRVQNPRFSAVLAGTPEQVARLIPSASNGEYSRFLFYCVPSDYEYRVNLHEDEEGYARKTDAEEFGALGEQFYKALESTEELPEIQFKLSAKNRERLQRVMQFIQDSCRAWKGDGVVSILHRLGSYTMRLTVALTFLRHMDRGDFKEPIWCEDRDFINALIIAATTLSHSMNIYGTVVKAVDTNMLLLKGIDSAARANELWEKLPDEFTTKECEEAARAVGVSWHTADKWVRNHWLKDQRVERVQQGKYKKLK